MTEQTQAPEEAKTPAAETESEQEQAAESGKEAEQKQQEQEQPKPHPTQDPEALKIALRQARRETREVREEFKGYQEQTARRFEELAEKFRKLEEPDKDQNPEAWRDWKIQQLEVKQAEVEKNRAAGTDTGQEQVPNIDKKVLAYASDELTELPDREERTRNFHNALVKEFMADGLSAVEADQEAQAEEIKLMERAYRRGVSLIGLMDKRVASAAVQNTGAGKEKLMKGKEAENTTGTVDQPGSGPPPPAEDIDEFLRVKDDKEFHERWEQFLRRGG